jgi:hypothetical protein
MQGFFLARTKTMWQTCTSSSKKNAQGLQITTAAVAADHIQG